MGTLIAVTLPVVPGQSERVRNFAKELEPHRAEFERLNEEATVTRYVSYLQETPIGDFEIVVMEVDDPSRLRTITGDESAYDRWWLDYLRDVHGVDLRSIPADQQPAPPPATFTWPG